MKALAACPGALMVFIHHRRRHAKLTRAQAEEADSLDGPQLSRNVSLTRTSRINRFSSPPLPSFKWALSLAKTIAFPCSPFSTQKSKWLFVKKQINVGSSLAHNHSMAFRQKKHLYIPCLVYLTSFLTPSPTDRIPFHSHCSITNGSAKSMFASCSIGHSRQCSSQPIFTALALPSFRYLPFPHNFCEKWDVFIILTVAIVSRVYTSVKTDHTIHFKYVQFILC